MPSYTLEIEAFGVYATNMPSLEIWEDGVLDSTHSISSSGSTISVIISYGGSVPTSLAFTFNDGFAAAGRTIEIRSVKINDQHVNVGNYLSSDSLVKSATATVDVASSEFLFDSSDPALSNFTTGATRTFTAGADNLRHFSGTSDEIFDALGGRDTIYLGSGNDKIFGNGGNDVIYSGAGNDLISGGADNDRIYGQDGNDQLYGGLGNDRIHGGNDDDEIHGGAGDDRLNGNSGNDVITGGAGDDKLHGSSGDDFLYGGADDDVLVGGNGADTLDGGTGIDVLYGGNGNDTLNGGDGVDMLIGNAGADIIHGDAGDDTIHAGADNDTIYGGADNDTINGEGGVDTIDGGTGNDVVIGGDGADIIDGGIGNDVLHGHGLSTTEVNTILNANPAVSFNVNTNSFYQYVNSGNTHATSYANATGSMLGGVAGHLVNVTSQAEQDYLTTNFVTGSEVWIGASDAAEEGRWEWTDGAEAGLYFWEGGPATFGGVSIGSTFNSWPASGSSGPNNAGAGQDLPIMYNSGDWDDTDGSYGWVRSVIEWDAGLMSDDNAIDTISGGAGDDTIYGYGGNDVLDGGDGGDVIFGGAGDDNIEGGNDAGEDSLYGGAGDDVIAGRNGNDVVDGGADDDTIYGNNGDDILTGGTGVDTVSAGDDNDLIRLANGDFAAGEYIDGGNDTDELIFTNATTVDFTTGTLTNLETLTGSDGNDDVTLTIQQGLSFTNVDFGGGTDNSRIQVSGIIDVTALSGPAVLNSENGFLEGSAGADDLTITGAQLDSLIYGAGTIDFAGGADVLNLTSTSTELNTLGATNASILGLETISASTAGASVTITLSGQTENLTITGGTSADTISSGTGNDVVNGGAGADIISAVSGNNTLNGDAGNDTITGGSNSETLNGGGDDDIINGNNGSDTLNGDAGDDIINGGSGNDTVTGGTGNDTMDGGSGTGDTAVFSGNWGDYNITLLASTYTLFEIATGETDTATNFENFEFADVTQTTANIINNKPVITSNGGGSTASISIAENGTAVTTVTATDVETPGSLTYAITGGIDSSLFSITAGGILTFLSAPDFETPLDSGFNNIYDVQVTVTDGDGKTDAQSISVSVTDVAEGDVGSTPGTAGTIAVGGSITYDVSAGGAGGDHDWYAVTLTSGTDYAFWARGTPTEAGTATDPRIFNLYESDGTTSVGSDDDSGVGYESLLTYTATYTGTYYIDAGTWGGTGSITLSAFVNGGRQVTGAGVQTLTGTANSDYLESGDGNDTLNGLGGSDILWGENNDDILNGGSGADVLYGGTGADTFVLWDTDAADSIVDFTTGEGDALDISSILIGFDVGIDDIDDFVQFTTVGGSTSVSVDVNGLVGGASFTNIAMLEGNTGEVVQTLYDNGDIIV
jgi:Ca2+-binding RTX toxin-like protein